LKFLGELSCEQTAPVAAALADVAAETRGGTLSLRGLGAFPTAERARVVWAGLADAEELIEAAANCERRIAPLGFPTEARGFTPHVTLARIPGRTPAAVADLLAEHPASDFGTTPFAAIELFQSEPTPRGPRYVSLSRTPVTG
jgi:2'-5' RNA ligase